VASKEGLATDDGLLDLDITMRLDDQRRGLVNCRRLLNKMSIRSRICVLVTNIDLSQICCYNIYLSPDGSEVEAEEESDTRPLLAKGASILTFGVFFRKQKTQRRSSIALASCNSRTSQT